MRIYDRHVVLPAPTELDAEVSALIREGLTRRMEAMALEIMRGPLPLRFAETMTVDQTKPKSRYLGGVIFDGLIS